MITIDCKRGDDLELAVTCSETTGGDTDVMNLTGCDVVCTLNTRTLQQGDVLVTDALNGELTVLFDHDVTKLLGIRAYLADVEVTFPDGRVETPVTFLINITRDVTP